MDRSGRSSKTLTLGGEFWLERKGRGALGRQCIALLEQISETGSISAAARVLGISYKTAWDEVNAMNNLSDAPLVVRVSGGCHGGGTTLTRHGLRLLSCYRLLEEEGRRFVRTMDEGLQDLEQFSIWMRRWAMRTSVRNQLRGTVREVIRGAVNTEVIVDLGGGGRAVAMITNEGVEALSLEEGREVHALIKESSVFLGTGDEPRISARNRLRGTVIGCQEGAVNGEVVIELPGGKTLVSIISNAGIRRLGIRPGAAVWACIKASDVMLAVND